MIEFTKSYKTQDGQTFADIKEAKVHELVLIVPTLDANVAGELCDNEDAVVDILTMKPTSKPRARKSHGATKNRKSKAAAPAPPAA